MSVATVPTSYQVTGLDILWLMGQVMLHAGFNVKCITCDNASTHKMVKALMLGLPHGLSQQELASAPFWKLLRYISFPGSSLPRWPFKKPCVNDEVLFPDSKMFSRSANIFFATHTVTDSWVLISLAFSTSFFSRWGYDAGLKP